MNEEALNYSYELFKKDGYNGTVEDYSKLLSENEDALNHSYSLFQKDGYNDSEDDYRNLLSLKKKAESTSTNTELVSEPKVETTNSDLPKQTENTNEEGVISETELFGEKQKPETKSKVDRNYESIYGETNVDDVIGRFENEEPSDLVERYNAAGLTSENEKNELRANIDDDSKNKGLWNTIKQGAKNYWNNLIPENALKVSTDNLNESKEKAKKFFKKEGLKPTDNDLKNKATSLEYDKREASLIKSKKRGFMKTLSDADRSALLASDGLKESAYSKRTADDVIEQKILRKDAENNVLKTKEIEFEIIEFQKKNEEVPEFLKKEYTDSFELSKQKILKAKEQYLEYAEDAKELGNIQSNIDLFKRDFGWFTNFAGNIASAEGNILSGLAASAAYVNDLRRTTSGTTGGLPKAFSEYFLDKSKNIKKTTEGIQDKIMRPLSVDDINTPGDFGSWLSNTAVAQQIPILTLIGSGYGGMTALGLSSTGQKYSEMTEEDKKKLPEEEKYSASQKFGVPIAFGVADFVGTVVDASILKGTGRIFKSATTAERKIIAKNMFQKATDLSGEFLNQTGKALLKEVPEEMGVQVFQNGLDIFALNKKGINLGDGVKDAAAASIPFALLPGGAVVAKSVFKPFSRDSKLDNALRDVELLESKLNNPETVLSEKARTLITKKLKDKKTKLAEISIVLSEEMKSMSENSYNKVLKIEEEKKNIREDALEIKKDNSIDESSKELLLKEFQEDFNQLENKQKLVLNTSNSNKFNALSPQEKIKVKEEAQKVLVKEKQDAGETEFKISDSEITEKANELSNKKPNPTLEETKEGAKNKTVDNTISMDEVSRRILKDRDNNPEIDKLNKKLSGIRNGVERSEILEQIDALALEQKIKTKAEIKSEGKKVDIEKRRQVELDKALEVEGKGLVKSSEVTDKGVEKLDKKGDIYNQGLKVNATFMIAPEGYKDGKVEVIVKQRKPQINKDGVMTQPADVTVMGFSSLKEGERYISENTVKVNPKRIPRINAEFDAELDALENETQTKGDTPVNENIQSGPTINNNQGQEIDIETEAVSALESNKNETQEKGDTSVDGDVQPGNTVDNNKGRDQKIQPANDSKTSQSPIEVKEGDNTYTVTKDKGYFVVKNKKGKTPSKPTERKILRYIAETLDFTSGDKFKVQEGMTSIEFDLAIPKESNNAAELAELVLRTKSEDFINDNSDTEAIEIIDYIAGKVKKGKKGDIGNDGSFVNQSDANNITRSIARTYLRKDGQGLDTLAQELSEQMGVEITMQDIVDLIIQYPNGVNDVKKEVRDNYSNPAKARFSEITGLPSSDYYLQKAVDQLVVEEKLNEELHNNYLQDMTNAEMALIEQEKIKYEETTYERSDSAKIVRDTSSSETKSRVRENSNSTNEGKSPEEKQLEQKITEAQNSVSKAKTALENKSKKLDASIVEDQDDLFGERKSKTEDSLFDERVDLSQRENATSKERQALKDAQAELKRLKDVKKNLKETTSQIDFKENKKEVSVFTKLVNRLKRAFPKTKVNTNKTDFFSVLKERGFDLQLQANGSNYFSTAIQGVSNVNQKSATPEQWVKMIADKGGKGTTQELEWIGLADFLNDYKKDNNVKSVPKEVVEQYINDNKIEIVEVAKGGSRIKTYTPENYENYPQEVTDVFDKYLDDSSAIARDLESMGYLVSMEMDGNISQFSKMDTNEDSIRILEEAGYYVDTDRNGDTYIEKDEEIVDYNDLPEGLRSHFDIITSENSNDNLKETKYSDYQLEGGKNYREVLLTLPNKVKERIGKWTWLENKGYTEEQYGELTSENQNKLFKEWRSIEDKRLNDLKKQYTSSHWDESDILAHVRMNERTLPNGERVLFIEEVQSDWAQDGKKKGFIEKNVTPTNTKTVNDSEAKIIKDTLNYSKKKYKEELADFTGIHDLINIETGEVASIYIDKGDNINKAINKALVLIEDNKLRTENPQTIDNDNKIPNMPYKKTDQWIGMAIRRVMQIAVQDGFDRIAWATGEQSADRYSLAQKVDIIFTEKVEDVDDLYFVDIKVKDGTDISLEVENEIVRNTQEYKGKTLESIIGKELSKKILESEGEQQIKGEGLEFGGEGMKTFYNSILPKVAKKEAQRFDKSAKVDVVEIGLDNESTAYEVYDSAGKLIATNGNELYAKALSSQQNGTYKLIGNKTLSKQLSIKLTPKIAEKTSKGIPLFMKDKAGEVYGFYDTETGTVHLNPDKINSNTPIHEFGHVWTKMLRGANKELYNKGIELIKNTKYYKKIQENQSYAHLTEEQKLEEALVAAIGDKGEAFVNDLTKSKFRKFLDSVKEFLTETFFINKRAGIKKLSLDQFLDGALSDILGGKEIVPVDFSLNNLKTTDIIDKSKINSFHETLDSLDKDLTKYANENLSFGLPVALAQQAVKAMKLAVKTAKVGADIINAGAKVIKESEWYRNLNKEEKGFYEDMFGENEFLKGITSVIDDVKNREKKKSDNRAEKLKATTKKLREFRNDLAAYKKALISSVYDRLKLETLNNLNNSFNKGFQNKVNNAKTIEAVNKIATDINNKIAIEVKKSIDKKINKILKEPKKFLRSVNGKPKANKVDNETRKIFNKILNYFNKDTSYLETLNNQYESNYNKSNLDSDINEVVAIEAVLQLKQADALLEINEEEKRYRKEQIKAKKLGDKVEVPEINVEVQTERIIDAAKLKERAFNDFQNFLDEGKYNLKELIRAEAIRLAEITSKSVESTNNKFSDKRSSDINKIKESRNAFTKAFKTVITKVDLFAFRPVLSSFEFLSKVISTEADLNNSFLYTYLYKNKTGFVEASKKRYLENKSNQQKSTDFIRKNFKIKKNNFAFITFIQKSSKLEDKTRIVLKQDRENGIDRKMSKFNALSIYLWSRMDGMQNNLLEAGYDDIALNQVNEFLGADYVKLGDWMAKQLENDYDASNKVNLEIMRTDISKVENYFPVQYNKSEINSDVDVEESSSNLLAAITPNHTIKRVKNEKALDDSVNAFKVFTDYQETMSHFKHFARVTKDANAILSNKNFRENLKNKTEDGYTYSQYKEAIGALVGVQVILPNKSIVKGGKILYTLTKAISITYVGLKLITASKQILSFMAVLENSNAVRVNLFDKDIRIIGAGTSLFVGKMVARIPMIYVDYKFLLKNSTLFKKRIEDGNIGSEIIGRAMKDSRNYTKLGHIKLTAAKIQLSPNKLMDVITIAWTGRALYNQQLSKYKKNGLSQTEAHEKAIRDFEVYMETSQQSSSLETLSENQRDKGWAGSFTAFKNSQQGYLRKEAAAIVGLTNSYTIERKRLEKNGVKNAGTKSVAKVLKNEKDQNKIKTLLLYGYVMPATWQYIASGLPGLLTAWDDDDSYEMKRAMVLGPIDGIFILKDALTYGSDIIRGKNWKFQPSILISEIGSFGADAGKLFDDRGDISLEIAYFAAKYSLKFTGILDLDSSVKIYVALENMIKDGEINEEDLKDAAQMPKSMREK